MRSRDVQSVVHELQTKVEKNVNFQPGYYITYGGAFENLNQAKNRLAIAVPISLVMIFVLLFFAFNSVRQGLLIYSSIPLSAIGGILFLAMRQMPFSISAGVGFIALFGVAVLNGIVLIAEFNRLKSEGWKDLKRIVLMGTKVRLRPVLMTAFVASLGFLPMALSNGAGAEVQRPLATVVIGGLLVATFLTLIVLPVLYILFENKAVKKQDEKDLDYHKNFKMNNKKYLKIMVLFGAFVFSSLKGQIVISLDASEALALHHNGKINNSRMKVAIASENQKTSAEWKPTEFAIEAGQINSVFFDTRLGIAQSLLLPKVNKSRKELLKRESSLMNGFLALNETDLKKALALCFNKHVYYTAKEKMLAQQDSLYNVFIERAKNRLKEGESDALEQYAIVQQKNALMYQLETIRQEAAINIEEFNYLINDTLVYIPALMTFKMDDIFLVNPPVLKSNHEAMIIAENEIKVAESQTDVMKTRLLPEFRIGYNNGSIRGTGADNLTYNASQRFNTVQLGIGIPLFRKGLTSSIKVAEMNQSLKREELELTKSQLELQLKETFLKYESNKRLLQYYEERSLKDVAQIKNTLAEQYKNGSINYLDYVLLVNQSIGIEGEYIDLVKNINEQIIEINYLSKKN